MSIKVLQPGIGDSAGRRRVLAGGLALLAGGILPGTVRAQAGAAECPALLGFSFNRLQDGQPQSLCQYAGKVVLVVNTASYCGFTPQYEGLEKLYADYRERGLVVLGFPSNDFGGQEPGGSKEIGELCFNTYGVKFPMFEKSEVTGRGVNPLYAALAKATGKKPGWNFHKYLIDRGGHAVGSYPSTITPTDRKLLVDIDRALGG